MACARSRAPSSTPRSRGAFAGNDLDELFHYRSRTWPRRAPNAACDPSIAEAVSDVPRMGKLLSYEGTFGVGLRGGLLLVEAPRLRLPRLRRSAGDPSFAWRMRRSRPIRCAESAWRFPIGFRPTCARGEPPASCRSTKAVICAAASARSSRAATAWRRRSSTTPFRPARATRASRPCAPTSCPCSTSTSTSLPNRRPSRAPASSTRRASA